MDVIQIMPSSAGYFLLELCRNPKGFYEGEIVHIYSSKRFSFIGLDDAISQMEQQMDKLDCPQATNKLRSFQNDEQQNRKVKQNINEKEQKTADIINFPFSKEKNIYQIRILYRRNSSWQGEIIWNNEKKYFRSVLEVLHLIHSSMQETM